jgi:hypothetical protein
MEGLKMSTGLAEKLPENVTNFPAIAMATKVVDADSLGRAGEVVKTLREFRRQTTDWFKVPKEKAHSAWKELCARETEALAPLERAEAHVRGEMNRFTAEEERKRQEAERIARAKAEEDARRERERFEAQATKAEARGNADKAEELREKAEDVYVAPTAVAPTLEPVKSGSATTGTQTKLVVEVTDLKAFLGELIKQGSALTMIEVKPSKLEAWAKANAIERFPGLRVEKTKIAVVR